MLADNTRRQSDVPDIQRGWHSIGSILGEVALLRTGSVPQGR